MKPFTSILLLFLILSGCTSKPTESIGLVSQTATLQPTVTKTPTPDATPTPTQIHLRIPTLTQRPILPATRIPPTVPVATLNAKATLEPLEELCDEFETDSDRASEMSPSGEWFAIRCGYDRNQKLIVVNLKGTKWVFDFATFLRPKIEGMPGAFWPMAWSSDGRFLYFSKVLGYSGGGNQCFPGFGVYGLYRLHLQSGTLVTLISKNDEFPGDKIDFSPNNDYYAIALDGVRITNLVSGEVTNIHVSGVMEMSWSPDGKFLVFSIASCGEEFVESSTIYAWDSATKQTQVLFSTNEMLLKPDSWIDNSALEFRGEKWDGDIYRYTIFKYDLAGDKMIFSGTATPRP